MRVYVPATVSMLRDLVDKRELHAVGGTAFALTPALREAYASGDDEELSEVAMAEAARASLRLLADEAHSSTAPMYRRAVIAVDVTGATLRPDLDDAVVKLDGPIEYTRVGSVHMDLAEAESAVAKATDIVDAADLGDEDAEFVLGDAEDHQLAWYATQELPFLLDLL
ncbi:hypothetical protein HGA13_13165 [Nocardia speluncae]|uniref:Uncharacterized protein n=1 Tax=Nocardia speluncae TaxID=419477 RepID=A0A846XH33_9NOCA|nr:hypothetical protein [Nocardia speluncae]NKY34020.1 hypothetical protein [Nocardia speluncae]